MAQAKYPKTIDAWNSYFWVAIPYINTHQARLGISSANRSALNNLYDDPATGNGWLQIFPKTQGNEATTALRKTRNKLRSDIQDLLQIIYLDIPESKLTEDDRQALRTFKRDTKATARGPISTAPDVSLTPLEGAKIRQRLRFDTDKNRASTHPLADGWERAVKIGGTAPANPDQCPIRETGTKALSTISAGMANDGKRYYAFYRWANFTNKANNSGWSPMKVVTVSGGTVVTE
jgi:hypothetical protein